MQRTGFHEIKSTRGNQSFILQQELEQSQNSTKQFSKAYYDLHPRLCHLRATNNELKREYSLLKTKIDSIKECQICNEQFDHGMHQPAKATCGRILYCKSCLTSIGNSTGKCPACRENFQSKHVVAVNLSFV